MLLDAVRATLRAVQGTMSAPALSYASRSTEMLKGSLA